MKIKRTIVSFPSRAVITEMGSRTVMALSRFSDNKCSVNFLFFFGFFVFILKMENKKKIQKQKQWKHPDVNVALMWGRPTTKIKIKVQGQIFFALLFCFSFFLCRSKHKSLIGALKNLQLHQKITVKRRE